MTTEWYIAAATALMFGGLALAIYTFQQRIDAIRDWKIRENYARRVGRDLLYLCLGCFVLVTATLGYLTCGYLL